MTVNFTSRFCFDPLLIYMYTCIMLIQSVNISYFVVFLMYFLYIPIMYQFLLAPVHANISIYLCQTFINYFLHLAF